MILLQVLQTICVSRRNKEFLCIEKINIKADVELVFMIELDTTKTGKKRFRPFIDGTPWKRWNATEYKGSLAVVQDTSKKIKTFQMGSGFSISVTKLSGHFKLDLEISKSATGVRGLCNGTVETLEAASADLSATHVSYVLNSLVSLFSLIV